MNLPKIGSGRAGLLQFAELLEAEQIWRDTVMVWDFTEIFINLDKYNEECMQIEWPEMKFCGTVGCAIGLLSLADGKPSAEYTCKIAERFEMPAKISALIFLSGELYRGKTLEGVQPGDVAAAIRQYLDGYLVSYDE